MDLLFSHHQQKKDRYKKTSNQQSQCLLRLYIDGDELCYEGIFDFDYDRYGSRKHITFEHNLIINLNTGDIKTAYKIINDGLTEERMFRNNYVEKKNNFKQLFDLVENGIARGEKRRGFWGVKYERAVDTICDILLGYLHPKFKSKFYKNKNYKNKHVYNSIYDSIVDFHLDMKNIKAHNGIYHDIQNDYPKKKWLEKNDYKFLPSVLDSYGIKSKYLIGELSKSNFNIQISSLNYLCKLFGDNHIEYLKRFVWETHCYDIPPNKRVHKLKNESEKDFLVQVINHWEKDTLKTDTLIYSLNRLFSIRELLEEKGFELKYKAKNDSEFDNTMEVWSGLKSYFTRGYKIKYNFSEEFVSDIEQPIHVKDLIFIPTVLVTEDDFRLEGFNMKNCMAKQFPHGAIYIYVALQHKRKRINLQYRKGNIVQSYGKANTPVDNIFEEASNILSNRFKKYTNLEWKKEKYDLITN
jgi:hypothetical protein